MFEAPRHPGPPAAHPPRVPRRHRAPPLPGGRGCGGRAGHCRRGAAGPPPHRSCAPTPTPSPGTPGTGPTSTAASSPPSPRRSAGRSARSSSPPPTATPRSSPTARTPCSTRSCRPVAHHRPPRRHQRRSRAEGAAIAAQRPDLLPFLKVCYAEDRVDNCGRCGKCIITMAALMGVDALDAATGFPGRSPSTSSAAMRPAPLQSRQHWIDVVRLLDDTGRAPEVRDAILHALRRAARPDAKGWRCILRRSASRRPSDAPPVVEGPGPRHRLDEPHRDRPRHGRRLVRTPRPPLPTSPKPSAPADPKRSGYKWLPSNHPATRRDRWLGSSMSDQVTSSCPATIGDSKATRSEGGAVDAGGRRRASASPWGLRPARCMPASMSASRMRAGGLRGGGRCARELVDGLPGRPARQADGLVDAGVHERSNMLPMTAGRRGGRRQRSIRPAPWPTPRAASHAGEGEVPGLLLAVVPVDRGQERVGVGVLGRPLLEQVGDLLAGEHHRVEQRPAC